MDGFGSCNPWLAILRQTRDTDRLKLDEAVAVGELDVPSKDKFDIVFQDEEPLERTTTSSLDEPMRPDVTELSALALQGDDNTQGIFSDAARSSSPEPMEEQETEDEGTPDQLPEDGEGKLKELKKEFGPITYSDSSQVESEQYDCETTAALIIGVLVKGIAFLTNHRFAFYALLPNITSADPTSPTGRVERLTGTGIIHFSSSLKPKKRAFLVLKSDSLNAYSSPHRLDEPRGCIHFSTIGEVKPLATPNSESSELVEFTFLQRVDRKPKEVQACCEFDDAVTASRWRNALAAAVFQYRNQRDRFRASIPLERIVDIELAPWMDFAQTVTIKYILGSGEEKTINFGFLSQNSFFIDRLQSAVSIVRNRHCCAGQLPTSNPPIVDIATPPTNVAKAGSGDNEAKLADEMEDQLDPRDAEEYIPTLRQIERFRFEFGLFGEEEDIYFATVGSLARTVPVFGKVALSKKGVMFSRKTAMTNRVKVFLPTDILKGAQESSTFLMNSFGLHIVIKGQEDLALVFPTKHRRDAVLAGIRSLARRNSSLDSPPISPISRTAALEEPQSRTRSAIQEWANAIKPNENPAVPFDIAPHIPLMIGRDECARSVPNQKFAFLTIGSRGDVQPYIALGKRLKSRGHQVCILTHQEYASWILDHGLEHRPVGGDPGLLMEISVEHKIFDSDTQKKFRKWFEDLLQAAYEQVKAVGAEILIESPSAFAGIHIAESLGLPFFRAFSMPWTKTGDFPHAFVNGPQNLSRAYNTSTYTLFEALIWRASNGMINKWRKQQLGLKPTTLDRMHLTRVPTLYFFSEFIVPRPLDWPNWVQITGSWVLPQSESSWEPPKDLEEFMRKAREDGKPLVYCGFGSITVKDPVGLTTAIFESAKAADVRMILSKGWSGRMQKGTGEDNPTVPEEVYQVDSIPHDWLFSKMDAVMHHGGAGTTSASLSAGVPTLIRPFFGDQYFWASRVSNLGAGLKVKGLQASDLTAAWKEGTTSRIMKERAEIVGAKLRQEDGVGRASDLIFAYLSSAKAAMQPDDTKDENSSKDQDVKSSGRRTILVAAPAKVDIDKEETQLRQGQASPKPLSKASIGTRLISPTGSRRTSSSQSDVQPASAHAEQSEPLTKKLASRLRGMSLSRGTGSSSSLPKP